MLTISRLPKGIFLAVILIPIMLSACGRRQAGGGRDKVVAFVNSEPVLASEVQCSLALNARQDPMFKATPENECDHLDMIIDKKLILQEAIKDGLAQDEKFARAIQSFWEQTLIRNFYEYKRKEFARTLFVTEDDIRKFYTLLGERVTFRLFRGDKRTVENVLSQLKRGKASPDVPWRVIGPVGYEDIDREVLLDAFELPAGRPKIFEDPPDYYLIQVVSRQTVDLPPFDSIRADVEERAMAMKEKRAFNKWLEDQRRRAKIKILGKHK